MSSNRRQEMPSYQIYVLETIVKHIELQPDVVFGSMNSICVGFKFAQLVNFDIDTECFSPPEVQANSKGSSIVMNYGKTFLFVAKSTELRDQFNAEPYHITLFDGKKSLGSTTENWKREFSDMIKYFDTLGIVKSTTNEENYSLRNEQGFLTAKIDIFMRMSCFGPNVQTTFQVKTGETPEYIFRQRNDSKTFKVEKYSDERNLPLVAPLYGGINVIRSEPSSQVNIKENVSLTQLFDRDHMFSKDTDADDGIRIDFQDDYDKVSICYRPSENKFFDLLDLISADIKTKDKKTEVTIQRKKIDRVSSFMKSVGGNIMSSPNVVVEEDTNDIQQMTADKIARKLCGNKDCPAVKKFKEYGIGPLATGKGLGTVYGDVEPPVTYGMSHTYGTMCEYGPYGVFSRPKQEELPFIPRNENVDLETRKPCKNRKEKIKQKNKTPTSLSVSCPHCSERLRGGADNNNTTAKTEDNGEVTPKSPMVECKSVMDQFDDILAEYKKALGPCGHATCPYGQNFSDDTCKKMCDQSPPPTKDKSSTSCNDSPCNVDGCPYAEDTNKNRYPAGCGSPKCAYTKYKLGLIDEDAELELQFLPPAVTGNCGDPHCKYPFSPPLPPIHWDCPDPLPKGPCRNLNCPFQPAPLKKFKTKKMLKTGPCGSPLCAYALPQPCANPTCPFAMTPCPMSEFQFSGDTTKCKNRDCPFSQQNAKKPVEPGIDDPSFEGEFQDCINPECPSKSKSKTKTKKSKRKKMKNSCENPDCPSTKKEKGKPQENDSDDVCLNPECPQRKKMLSAIEKSGPKCSSSSTSSSVSVCSDPECPYANLKKDKNYKDKKKGADDGSGASCQINEDRSICSNPECVQRNDREDKEKESDNVCNQPGCPYSKNPPDPTLCNDPRCPYLLPLPSCGVPNCPYEPVPLRFICKNPRCPSHSIDFSKKISKKEVHPEEKAPADVETTTVVVTTTTVCEDADPCEASELCDNPDCEMKEGEVAKLDGHHDMVRTTQKKRGRRKKRGKFVYSIGDTYPGTKIGHRECVKPVFNVPPNMGWLWNVYTPSVRLKPRRGWRPGALTKTIADRIRANRQAKGLGYLRVPTFKKGGHQFDDNDVKVIPKPTLQVQKKEGAYWITMNPLKDPYTLVENEDPYMECTPMTFKITKNKKPQEDFCYCDGERMPEDLKSTASSDSELDIEFTPPAGIIHPERFKKKPNLVCCDTQYDPNDFAEPKKETKGKEGKKGKDGKKGGKKGKDAKGGKGKGGKDKKSKGDKSDKEDAGKGGKEKDSKDKAGKGNKDGKGVQGGKSDKSDKSGKDNKSAKPSKIKEVKRK